MTNLDDEFARFEAEIQSLEQQIKLSNDERDTRNNSKEEKKPLVKKVKTESDRLTASPKLLAVKAKRKIYMTPPRPASVK